MGVGLGGRLGVVDGTGGGALERKKGKAGVVHVHGPSRCCVGLESGYSTDPLRPLGRYIKKAKLAAEVDV